MYRYIFFDLDGTLTDPREGITKSVQYALGRMGIVEEDLTKLEPFIGPPLLSSFMEYYHFSAERAREAVEYYREYFSVTGVLQNLLLDGVPELLADLKAHGKVLATASSKPEPFVRQILAHFQVDSYFDYICGGSMDESRINKEDVIEELIRRMELPKEEWNRILMVGDRRHDVEGAAHFGIPCLGLSIGFAAEGELEKAGAVAIVGSMEEVGAYILGKDVSDMDREGQTRQHE